MFLLYVTEVYGRGWVLLFPYTTQEENCLEIGKPSKEMKGRVIKGRKLKKREWQILSQNYYPTEQFEILRSEKRRPMLEQLMKFVLLS